MRLLTGGEISNILRNLTQQHATQLLEELQSGLACYTAEKSSNDDTKAIHQPLRTVIQTKNQDTTLIMPVSDTSTTSVKVATVPHKGDIKGAITVYSPVGDLLGLLNAAEITAFRTALATMTILLKWKKPKPASLVAFGAGKQSEWHIRLALLLVPGIKHVTVFNRTARRLEDFARTVVGDLEASHPGVQFQAIAQEGNNKYHETLRQQLAESDIICCCTPSTEVLFTSKDLEGGTPDGRFLSLIGSYKPHMQEVDGETLKLATKVWVDSKEACLEEAGELIRAKLGPNDLAEIGELFAKGNSTTLWDRDTPLTVFKCVGMGLMDLIIAKALLKVAEDLNKGTVVSDF